MGASASSWSEETIRTKGGEALPEEALIQTEPSNGKWHAVWTHSHCEQMVYQQLVAKGFQMFFPTIETWSTRGGIRTLSRIPMFSGYLFLRHAMMDHASYVEARKVRGLVRILGEGWDRLTVIPDAEISAIQKVVEAKLPALRHPYLREGQRVRIARGPLAGVEGILVQAKPDKGLLVLSIELFQRSIAVEVDCTLAVAA
jgi:transcription termination/antitermination protein NusG